MANGGLELPDGYKSDAEMMQEVGAARDLVISVHRASTGRWIKTHELPKLKVDPPIPGAWRTSAKSLSKYDNFLVAARLWPYLINPDAVVSAGRTSSMCSHERLMIDYDKLAGILNNYRDGQLGGSFREWGTLSENREAFMPTLGDDIMDFEICMIHEG
eukprot:706965-Pyramimonas_sp.AAC.1